MYVGRLPRRAFSDIHRSIGTMFTFTRLFFATNVATLVLCVSRPSRHVLCSLAVLQMVYWNEENDAESYENSVTIQDFGGFGSRNNNWQVTEGPFSNWTFHVGPGSNNYDHPITRAVNERQARSSGTWYVDGVRKQTAFADFKDLLYDTLHIAGHNGLGGGRGDVCPSPVLIVVLADDAVLDL